MNNYLPNDIMTMILQIRTIEMKKDKEVKDNRFNFDTVISDLIFINELSNTLELNVLSLITDFNDMYEQDKEQTELYGCWVNDRYDMEMY